MYQTLVAMPRLELEHKSVSNKLKNSPLLKYVLVIIVQMHMKRIARRMMGEEKEGVEKEKKEEEERQEERRRSKRQQFYMQHWINAE